MKRIKPLYIFLFLLTACSPKKERIENKIMECFYESTGSNANVFKKLILEYEQLLISEKILKNDKGESYRDIYKVIAKGDDLTIAPSKFFSKEFRRRNFEINDELRRECKNQLFKDSTLYVFNVYNRVSQINTKAIEEHNLSPSWVANKVLETLSDDDFELIFYKLRVFTLLESFFNLEDEQRELANKPNEAEVVKKGRINVFINKDNNYFINNDKVNIKELKIILNKLLLENKPDYIIAVSSNREVNYKYYKIVQEAIIETIKKLREKMSKEKFDIPYNELEKKKKLQIDNMYPMKFIDN